MRLTVLSAVVAVARVQAENPWIDPLDHDWPGGVSENAAYEPEIESKCRLLFQVNVDPETTVNCCECCELGYYLTTNFVAIGTTKWEDRVILKGVELEDYNYLAHGVSTDSGSGSGVLKSAPSFQSRPCSRCVDRIECSANDGTINDWHRTCMYK